MSAFSFRSEIRASTFIRPEYPLRAPCRIQQTAPDRRPNGRPESRHTCMPACSPLLTKSQSNPATVCGPLPANTPYSLNDSNHCVSDIPNTEVRTHASPELMHRMTRCVTCRVNAANMGFVHGFNSSCLPGVYPVWLYWIGAVVSGHFTTTHHFLKRGCQAPVSLSKGSICMH